MDSFCTICLMDNILFKFFIRTAFYERIQLRLIFKLSDQFIKLDNDIKQQRIHQQ